MTAPQTPEARGRYLVAAIEEQAQRIYTRTAHQQFFCCITPEQFHDLTTAYLGRASDHHTKLCELRVRAGLVLIRGDRQTEEEGITVTPTTGLPVLEQRA